MKVDWEQGETLKKMLRSQIYIQSMISKNISPQDIWNCKSFRFEVVNLFSKSIPVKWTESNQQQDEVKAYLAYTLQVTYGSTFKIVPYIESCNQHSSIQK